MLIFRADIGHPLLGNIISIASLFPLKTPMLLAGLYCLKLPAHKPAATGLDLGHTCKHQGKKENIRNKTEGTLMSLAVCLIHLITDAPATRKAYVLLTLNIRVKTHLRRQEG